MTLSKICGLRAGDYNLVRNKTQQVVNNNDLSLGDATQLKILDVLLKGKDLNGSFDEGAGDDG